MSKRNRGNRQEFEASSAIFWTGFLLTSEPSALTTEMACSLTLRRVCASLERQEAIEEAPRRARGEPQGCTERRRFPLRAYTNVHHDRCRPEVAVA